MAQLTYNTMRFGTDNFKITEDTATALLIAKEPLVQNFEWSILEEFIINADIPAGTDVRFAFTTDVENRKDQIFILANNGANHIAMETLINPDSWLGVGAYTVDDITADIVLENGNTITSLQALNGLELASGNIDAKRYFRPIIALFGVAGKKPKVKMSVKVSKVTTANDLEDYKSHSFDVPTKIVDVTDLTEIQGEGSATLTAAYKTTANGDYGDYSAVGNLIGKTVYGVRTKYQYHVKNINEDDRIIGKISAILTEDVECAVFGDTADIFSITKNFYLPLKYCVVVVKHAALNGAKIEAYANLAPQPLTWVNKQIGTGTGSEQTITLTTAKYLDVETLKVYVNGNAITDYTCNVENNTITLTAAKNATITAYYSYNFKAENWIKLTADDTQHDVSDGKLTTRFWSKITDANIYCSSIRLKLYRAEPGEAKTITIPITPNGQEQSYRISESNIELLDFKVKDNTTNKTVYSYAGNVFNDERNYDIEARFNSTGSLLYFTIPTGDYTLTAEYRKKGVVPKIYSWTAGWCV